MGQWSLGARLVKTIGAGLVGAIGTDGPLRCDSQRQIRNHCHRFGQAESYRPPNNRKRASEAPRIAVIATPHYNTRQDFPEAPQFPALGLITAIVEGGRDLNVTSPVKTTAARPVKVIAPRPVAGNCWRGRMGKWERGPSSGRRPNPVMEQRSLILPNPFPWMPNS
eukprot:gene15595-biopygen2834